jgi:hypothetical protein
MDPSGGRTSLRSDFMNMPLGGIARLLILHFVQTNLSRAVFKIGVFLDGNLAFGETRQNFCRVV